MPWLILSVFTLSYIILFQLLKFLAYLSSMYSSCTHSTSLICKPTSLLTHTQPGRNLIVNNALHSWINHNLIHHKMEWYIFIRVYLNTRNPSFSMLCYIHKIKIHEMSIKVFALLICGIYHVTWSDCDVVSRDFLGEWCEGSHVAFIYRITNTNRSRFFSSQEL